MFESNNEGGGDELYYGYVETTRDAGNIPLILSLAICLITLMALPLTVTIVRRHKHSQHTCSSSDSCAQTERSDHNSGHVDEGNETSASVPPTGQRSPQSFDVFPSIPLGTLSEDMSELNPLDAGIRRKRRGATRADNVGKRRLQVQRGIAEEARVSAVRRQMEGGRVAGGVSVVIHQDGIEASRHSPPSSPKQVFKRPLETLGQHADSRRGGEEDDDKSTKKETLRERVSQSVDFFLDLASYDNETRRILRLAVPFTISALLETVVDLVELALVSFYVGTEAMVAWALVDIIVGIGSEFLGGFIESVSSLTSMASGAGNNRLCGEYVQIITGFYALCQIPFIFIWSFSMESIMLLMGFDEYTSLLAKDFARVAIFVDIVEGVSEGFYDFLEVIGHETYSNVMGCIEALVELGLIALFAIKTDADLVILGLIMIVNISFFLLLNIAITVYKGWLKAFEYGLIGGCAFRNRTAVRQVIKTSVPLAFGSLMAYAEWEILTVFAAFLGPAEAASWATLSFVWDTFEATTEGIGDAAEVRCAYHLGKNRPDMAKRSSYKSIHLAAIVAFLATSIFLIMGEDLPTWLTSDPTLQHMLAQQIPLVGIGVSFMHGLVMLLHESFVIDWLIKTASKLSYCCFPLNIPFCRL